MLTDDPPLKLFHIFSNDTACVIISLTTVKQHAKQLDAKRAKTGARLLRDPNLVNQELTKLRSMTITMDERLSARDSKDSVQLLASLGLDTVPSREQIYREIEERLLLPKETLPEDWLSKYQILG